MNDQTMFTISEENLIFLINMIFDDGWKTYEECLKKFGSPPSALLRDQLKENFIPKITDLIKSFLR